MKNSYLVLVSLFVVVCLIFLWADKEIKLYNFRQCKTEYYKNYEKMWKTQCNLLGGDAKCLLQHDMADYLSKELDKGYDKCLEEYKAGIR